MVDDMIMHLKKYESENKYIFDIIINTRFDKKNINIGYAKLKHNLILLKYHKMISNISFYMSYYYMKKIYKNNNIHCDEKNICILYIIGLCIANKFIDDSPYNNQSYCELLNIPIRIFNNYELVYLNLINYDLGIDMENLKELCK